jgi:hypothetical protein
MNTSLKKLTSVPAIQYFDTAVILPVAHQRHQVVQLRSGSAAVFFRTYLSTYFIKSKVVLQILAVARSRVVASDVDAGQRRGSATAMVTMISLRS